MVECVLRHLKDTITIKKKKNVKNLLGVDAAA